ncbi:hypothetical protein [Acinetobacter haemolyticus]|uniref:hypothetical protein n=1 Tax=Acinetobacter haemolyticus TaxID=29430 RepID=UPI000E584B3E|nr:hypothetical protein [Acinetobacter haemolyticus]QDJ91881.1 hypothetical protein AhaeAN54_007200 [Acinetobacter haemolyticus]
MKRPVPKTKMDELGELVNNFEPNEILGEFKYARCLRLLDSSKRTTPKDLWAIMKGLVELSANNLLAANESAQYVLANTKNFKLLRNSIYIFAHTFDMENACKAIGKIVDLAELQKLEYKNLLPMDLGLEFLLNGEIGKPDSYFYSQAVNVNNLEYNEYWQDIYEELDISEQEFKKISLLIKIIVFKHNARCLILDYSYLDEEFLLLIYVDKPVEEIIKINEELFEACFHNDLLNAFNKISYTFVPYDEVQNG